MPETRMVRRRSNLNQLRKLYAHRPITAAAGAATTAEPADALAVAGIDHETRRYLKRDIVRTLITVVIFLCLFLVLYATQSTPRMQRAITWVGVHTGF